jgi:site-specific recombinase XerD
MNYQRKMKIKDLIPLYLEWLEKRGLREHTIKEHKRFLFGAISHSLLIEKNVEKLTLADVASVMESGRQHGFYGPQRAVCVFRQLLKFAKDSGLKLQFDWRDVPVPKVPSREQPILEKDEFEALMESFPIYHSNAGARKMALCMRALCEVLFATGMRISETLTLKRDQIEEIKNKRELIIKGKGEDERKVFFSDRAIYWLEEYLKQRNDNSPAMFVNAYGEPLKYTTAKSYILRFRKKLGYLAKKVKFHTFRRTLGTYLFEKGANVKDVQIILGHKSERTTLRCYIKWSERKAKNRYLKIMDKMRTCGKL